MKLTNLLPMKVLAKPLILLWLLLSPLIANADLYYSINGEIVDVTNKAICLDDNYYKFLSTVKVLNLEGQSESVASLKKGDPVKITILRIDGKRRVDSIQRVAKPDERSSRQ